MAPLDAFAIGDNDLPFFPIFVGIGDNWRDFQFVMVLLPKYCGYGSHDYTIDSQFITAVVVHYNLFCLELHRSMPLSPGKMPLIC